MEDSTMFMQWAMDTLLNEHPEEPAIGDGWGDGETTFPSLQALRDASQAVDMVRELMADDANAANSWSSGDGDITDGGSGGGGGTVPAPAAARDCSFMRAPPPGSNANLPAVSWNFVTGSAQPDSGSGGMLEEAAAPRSLSEVVRGSPPARRTSPKRSGAASSASYAPDHIIAERKRREKINKRLIELSTVIPGLKKMDKATILSDAAKYVKELQQQLKALEEAAAGGNAARSNETAVPVKKPRNVAVAAPDENGSPSTTTSASSSSEPLILNKPALPEIQAQFSEKSAMVRVHCGSGKGVAVAVLAEVEELGLSIVHANVMPFSATTVIITITAKVEEGFTMTVEEIVGRLNSELSQNPRIATAMILKKQEIDQASVCNTVEDISSCCVACDQVLLKTARIPAMAQCYQVDDLHTRIPAPHVRTSCNLQ